MFYYIFELTISVCAWQWSCNSLHDNSLHGSSWWYRWYC